MARHAMQVVKISRGCLYDIRRNIFKHGGPMISKHEVPSRARRFFVSEAFRVLRIFRTFKSLDIYEISRLVVR